jgi:hypothetical protein
MKNIEIERLFEKSSLAWQTAKKTNKEKTEEKNYWQ